VSAHLRPESERFWEKVVEREDGCWEWMAARYPRDKGLPYGLFRRRDGKQVQAHRWAWGDRHGFIPEGLMVLHDCDNAWCVNPAHLKLGTHADNMNDRQVRGRHMHGERHLSAKLTTQAVRDIRAARAKGASWASLGRRYGISNVAARQAGLGNTWRHVS
jgi:hypothetical protein